MKAGQLNIDELILGAGRLGNPTYKETCFALLDRYLDMGFSTLDVARSYESGLCETFLGEYFRLRKNRNRFTLISKGGFPLSRAEMDKTRLDQANMRQDLEETLGALGTDHVDIYFMHRDDVTREPGELLTTMNQFAKEGKVRVLGASNWSAGRIGLANEFAKEQQLQPFAISQINWSLALTTPPLTGDITHMVMNNTEFSWYHENQFPVIAYSVQAKGFFSKVFSGEPLKESGRKSYLPLQENFRRAERLKQLSQEIGYSMPSILISYILSQDIPSAAIGGFSSVAQLEDAREGAALRLSKQQILFLEGKNG